MSISKSPYKNLKIVIVIIIVLYMINNLEHSTHVYYAISRKQLGGIFGWPYADWLQSIIVIIVLDLSVIIWIRLNRFIEAGIFEILILVLNLLYYEWPGVFEPEVNRRIAEVIFASMFCFGVSSFAYIWAKVGLEDNKNHSIQEETESVLSSLNTKLEHIQSEMDDVISRLNQSKLTESMCIENTNQLRIELNQNFELLNEAKKAQEQLGSLLRKEESARTCEHCNELQESIDSKRVHKGQCHLNPKKRKMGGNQLY